MPLDDFNHGTHVAGIIAAPANGIGTAGVANEAEIVAVKVLSAYTGSGSFGGIIQGIVYAADIDADVINMSLGAVLPRTGFWDDNGTPDPGDDIWVGANEVTALMNVTSRATRYAHERGTVVIASAGNESIDRDHDGSLLVLPADCSDVIAIAATGPVGWADDPTTDLDLPASYSNYGQSRISFAAPGGDFQLYPAGLWYLDMVLSPGGYSGGLPAWYWAAGTSMAAPHATAVAALIIGQHGGKMHPAEVEAALRASADDLGKPGNDDFYGAGRVNAAQAVQ